jgi:hypothetical protein
MDKDVIRLYLWDDVFRLGFQLDDVKNQKKWLRSFLGSLREFWELGDDLKGPSVKDGKIVGQIDNSHFNLWVKFVFSADGHLHVEFGHLDGRVLYYHSDPNYFAPVVLKLLESTQRNVAIGESDLKDLVDVLDACMFHPREHLHIAYPEFDHQVRIGGGISNPFLYLFHLRYQFCPPALQKREAERRRLLELFEAAIKTNSSISANDLMAQPVF